MILQQKLEEYERFFTAEHTEPFELLPGKGKIMLSAPHSVSQVRQGRLKYAEPYTGVLVRLLQDSLGCPVIYKTKNVGDDANFDPVSPYREAIVDHIRQNGITFVIDLHQMAPARPEMVCFGTGNFKNIPQDPHLNILLQAFAKQNLGLTKIDDPFGAAHPYTIASTVARECGIPAVQIELNSNLFQKNSATYNMQGVFNALQESILAFGKRG